MEKMKQSLINFCTTNPAEPHQPEGIQDYFMNMIESMPNNVYWLNEDCITLGCNRNVLNLIGLNSIEEFVGITYEEMSRLANWTEGQAESFKQDDMRVIATGKPKLNVEEPPLYDKFGNPVYYMSNRVPLFDKDKNVIGVLGVSVDITELKQAQTSLVKAKEEAELANQLKTAFIRNMEHDIRTPFSGIYGMVKILEEEESDPHKKKCLSLIANSAQQLLSYCNGILDFSKLETGQMPLISKKFNLRELIDDVILMEKPAAELKGLVISSDYFEQTSSIFIGDPYRIQRILVNLVSNSVKFTHQGHIKIILQKCKIIDERKNIVSICIEDTGIGIHEEKQVLLFEKFNRLSPSNQGLYRGSGLGLTIVKQLVEELDGDIDLVSVLNQGTKITINLPLKRPLIDEE